MIARTWSRYSGIIVISPRLKYIVCPQIGLEVAHPGVSNDFGDVDARKYYTYYQWVCFVLFFQVGGPLIRDLSHVRRATTRSTLHRVRRAPDKKEAQVSRRLLFLPIWLSCCLSADPRLSLYIWRRRTHVQLARRFVVSILPRS